MCNEISLLIFNSICFSCLADAVTEITDQTDETIPEEPIQASEPEESADFGDTPKASVVESVNSIFKFNEKECYL